MLKKSNCLLLVISYFVWAILSCPITYAWSDQAHMAIARAAGLRGFHNACAPDVSRLVMKINRFEQTAGKSHFFNTDRVITRQDVYDQILILKHHKNMDKGYILGAIIETMRCAKATTESNHQDDYSYAILAHYVGDLTQPLHIYPYNEFNKKNHLTADNTLEDKDVVWEIDGAIRISRELRINDNLRFKNEEEVIDHLVTLANESYELAKDMEKNNRLLTRKEAIERVSKAASFMRAIMIYCGKNSGHSRGDSEPMKKTL